MVNGLDIFRTHFAAYQDQYTLIGGAACDIHASSLNFSFRATRDLDIVLCIEALSEPFVRAFWQFIHAGGYRYGQRADGRPQFYRFKNPTTEGYPLMLEIFSRRPNMLEIPQGVHLTPIPMDEDVSSLSAILLDDDYAGLIQEQRLVVDDVPVVSVGGLIVLKARAWMDLRSKRQMGMAVDSKDVHKHRNDIIRLVPFLAPAPMTLHDSIRNNMMAFLEEIENESLNPSVLKVESSWEEIRQRLRFVFG